MMVVVTAIVPVVRATAAEVTVVVTVAEARTRGVEAAATTRVLAKWFAEPGVADEATEAAEEAPPTVAMTAELRTYAVEEATAVVVADI